MVSALITATLAVIMYSLWIRRHTWWSRWEAAGSVAIALEGCALLLMSPWASATLGPVLHREVRMWNVQYLLGYLCFIVAITANIGHVLMRVANERDARAVFRKHVAAPVCVSAALLVTAFVIAHDGYHPNPFPADLSHPWQAVYWLVLSGLLIYLGGYAGRVALLARADPRAKATVDLYLVSTAFGLAGCVALISAAWVDFDVAVLVWLCVCLSVAIFAYGSARSWRAKEAWFTAGD